MTLIPDATVTVGIQGLAVLFHNSTFDAGRGRWEIAFPRFPDHKLTLEITGVGSFPVDPETKEIEIRDRKSLPVACATHKDNGKIDRTNPDEKTQDYRWVTSFGSDFSHRIISTKQPLPVPVTMMYVYDAVAYTRNIDSSQLIRPPQTDTGKVVKGEVQLPDDSVVEILDKTNDFLFEARFIGMDIKSDGGDAVDILVDGAKREVPHGSEAQQILMFNLEPPGKKDPGRFKRSDTFHYGLGDLYRYYDLFNLEEKGKRVHQWGRQKIDENSGPNGECCCNPVTRP